MRAIFLIGFRGTGFRDHKFANEPALIRAGHVGFFFEDDKGTIYGFHPTEEAVERVGGETEAIEWLKAKNILDGALQQDQEIFARAAVLASQGARTSVWQLPINVSDEEFDRIKAQTIAWYNAHQLFNYAFPPDEPLPDRDNCATFPRRLGLPLLDEVGQIKDYVRVLESNGTTWTDEGG